MEYISDDEYRQMSASRTEDKVKELEKKLDDLKATINSTAYKDSDKVITLSIKALKDIIRDIIKEELSKSFPYVPQVPYAPQPCWYGPAYPSEYQKVWCTDHTEPNVTNPCGSLGYKHTSSAQFTTDGATIGE